MKFSYAEREVDPRPGEDVPQFVYEPVIWIRVIGPVGACRMRGLLDTGSSDTLIPIRYLERLGVPRGPRFNLTAAGGSSFPVCLGNVDLELGYDDRPLRWSARVGFAPNREFAILGREGFLQFFTATFNGRKRSVSLQPNETFTSPIYADITP